jgi:aminoglycoside phosphotransferase family enzyme/predicted kinase
MTGGAFETCGDQSAVIAALSDPAAYAARAGVDAAAGETVVRHETHGSIVFLIGRRAYKMKRAVRYPYLDYGTPARRKAMCEAELARNRPAAPTLYLGTVAVTRTETGGLAVGGDGEAVEWLVEMARFDEAARLDKVAEAGGLDRRLAGSVADAVAAYHGAADPRPDADPLEMVSAVLEENAVCQSAQAGADGALDADAVAALDAASRAAFERLKPALRARGDQGFVRACHGDLHLRNLCLIDGRPVPFDAIEFNDAFVDIDVAYDLAFLLMDLRHRGFSELAAHVMNRWIDATGDAGCLALMPLYLSLRAGIRAHVEALTAGHASSAERAARHRADAGRYLDAARAVLDPPPARLIGVGGLSGTGKSRLARALAADIGAAPGARVVRSDVLRKRLAGAGRLDRLPPEAYGAEMTVRTFDALFAEIEAALGAGHSVIADAVFALPDHRARLAEAARRAGAPFQGLWLEADTDTRVERVESRVDNVSDAGADVARMQEGYDLGDLDWTRIRSDGRRAETLRAARAALGLGVS